MTIRLLIVDDHDMLRSGLRVFLESIDGMELVGEAASGIAAIQMCQALSPDVVLIDLKMPQMDGISAIRAIHQVQPDIRFVVLTSFVDETSVQEAMQAGASGYLMKNTSIDELRRAIEQAHTGRVSLSPEATQALVQATTRPPALGHDLTEREVEVLNLLVQGLNNNEIGAHLHISRSTVKNHISNIFSKLHTDSRTEAAALAIRHGIVKPQGE